jgi:hypothetical protein
MAAECRAHLDTLGCCLICPNGKLDTLAAVHTFRGRSVVRK